MNTSFEKWNFEDVENSFQTVRQDDHPVMAEWLAVDGMSVDGATMAELRHLQADLKAQVDMWNEEELKVLFIGPLLRLVNYQHSHYRPFLERKLTATIGDIEVGGVVDFLLAAGKLNPTQPYFCLHEYKRSRGGSNDPLGQLLIAMLCVKALNSRPQQPIYGVYIEGRFWYFVTLAEQTYAVTEPYTATQDDLLIIYHLLQRVKMLIEPFVGR